MDTLFHLQKNQNTHFFYTGISILIFIMCFQGMTLCANGIYSVKNSSEGLSVEISKIKQKIMDELSYDGRANNFDESIRQKYPKALITNIDTGIKHIQLTEYPAQKPVKINLIEIDTKLAKNYELVPALASTASLKSRRTIAAIAKENNAQIAINGTYFKPQTGVPLGALMINKKIYTGPVYDRAALGIFDNGFDIARVQMNASISSGSIKVKIDNINQPRMLSTYVLAYTSDWGEKAPASPKYGMQLSIDKDGKILASSANSLLIPEGGYVISGPKSILKQFWGVERVKVEIATVPEWKNVRHIISGGPYLVKNGEIFVDMTAEKLGAIGGRNPRSAIGYTADNNLILAVVDGREGSSIGMTLMELANFMKSAGCIGAINLDGGGSTVMYINGRVVNNPQVKGGIPISNAVVFRKTQM